MDTDRLGQMTRPLSRPVQGLTVGGWAIVAVLSGLVMLGGWGWVTRPTNDTDPWIACPSGVHQVMPTKPRRLRRPLRRPFRGRSTTQESMGTAFAATVCR